MARIPTAGNYYKTPEQGKKEQEKGLQHFSSDIALSAAILIFNNRRGKLKVYRWGIGDGGGQPIFSRNFSDADFG